MNVLITGGLGYIGGRIADYIKANQPDANVFLTAVNKRSAFPEWTKKFTVLQMNLLDEDSIVDCLKDKNIDIIIHLAAMNEIDSIKDPQLALEVNTKGTYRLLKHADINNINKFVYFSTFHVYGETSSPVITEQTPTRPFHPYAITHRAAEDFVSFFHHNHNMKTLVFRLSNAYGCPMHKEVNRWTLVFNDLCRQAVTTGRIVLRSSGRQYRDFISINDVARAVYHFLFVTPDKWADGLYNLGGDCSMSILEVAKKISDVYREQYKKQIKDIKVNSEASNSTDFKPVKYSIEKIKQSGFRLEGNCIEEIKKTMSLCERFIQ
jgi:UDP-glucose 4-epimerase